MGGEKKKKVQSRRGMNASQSALTKSQNSQSWFSLSYYASERSLRDARSKAMVYLKNKKNIHCLKDKTYRLVPFLFFFFPFFSDQLTDFSSALLNWKPTGFFKHAHSNADTLEFVKIHLIRQERQTREAHTCMQYWNKGLCIRACVFPQSNE